MVFSKKEVGYLIKKARNIKSKKTGVKYTQEMLAKDLGISRGYLGDFENGRIYPNYVLLNRIADVCGVPLRFFDDNNFSSRLKQAREELGLSRKELSDKSQVSFDDLTKYENDPLCEPTDIDIILLSTHLGVSKDYLLGEIDDKKFESMKKPIFEYSFDELLNSDKSESSKKVVLGKLVPVPLLGRIPAGVPMECLESEAEFIDTPKDQVNDGDYFYLRVVGDSMEGSRIYEGDLVLVKKQPDVESGEIAVVRVNGHDATLKRVKKVDGQVILYPDNPKYDPIFISDDDAAILGKVVKVEFDPNKKKY